ncbi:probable serine/threonine-protein kinase At1g54610 [Typha latifolia]|uniref:probable serine/threonine-protein kinase At1g54610 n=1 Tax=Typha latifolia TaxID=4733 RepID=UPI003C30CFFD
MGCILGNLAAPDNSCFTLFFPITTAPETTATGDVDDPLRAPLPREFIGRSTNSSGWPRWLSAAAGGALLGLTPRRADSFRKIEKIGSGTYSNVYKAVDLENGQVVALKKVRADGLAGEVEGAKFMAREIELLRRLDGHANVIRLEGLVTSRLAASPSLYLVFEYMDHDLAGLTAATGVNFSLPQVKCYMRQLLSGLEHCHNHHVLHRDIKSSNLLLSKTGILKIADFGLATSYDPDNMKPMTSKVVTLWYRPPELLLGATHYGVGVDLWSVGCIFAELLTGQPIFPGRTEVEQLHKIFKLCGSPSEDYWKKLKLSQASFKCYDRCIAEKFKDLPQSALSLLDTLLAIDPDERGTAAAALNSEFFKTEPYACEPSSLPQYPPSKEMDIKLRNERTRRKGRINGTLECETTKKARARSHGYRGAITPDVNAKLHLNPDLPRLVTSASVRGKMERFPPPHLDAPAIGLHLNTLHANTDELLSSSIEEVQKVPADTLFGPMNHFGKGNSSRKKGRSRQGLKMAPSTVLIGAFMPYSLGPPMEVKRKTRVHITAKARELDVVAAVK